MFILVIILNIIRSIFIIIISNETSQSKLTTALFITGVIRIWISKGYNGAVIAHKILQIFIVKLLFFKPKSNLMLLSLNLHKVTIKTTILYKSDVDAFSVGYISLAFSNKLLENSSSYSSVLSSPLSSSPSLLSLE